MGDLTMGQLDECFACARLRVATSPRPVEGTGGRDVGAHFPSRAQIDSGLEPIEKGLQGGAPEAAGHVTTAQDGAEEYCGTGGVLWVLCHQALQKSHHDLGEGVFRDG